MPSPRGPLLIVGASTRAAAESAARSGFEVFAIDRFGDADLRQVAEVVVADPWTEDAAILRAAAAMPPAPWLYTGAIENRPDLIEALSRERLLMGCPAEAVRRVRDPFELGASLRAAGLDVPEARRVGDGPPPDGDWLIKPLASGGGVGIRPFGPGPPPGPGEYLQRRVPGRSASALWLADPLRARLVGATRQVSLWTERGYEYRASVGPLPMTPVLHDLFTAIGSHLRSEFGLIGLFGADFVRAGRRWYLVEVNPRPTASLEVLEIATRWPRIDAHVRCCIGEEFFPPSRPTGPFAKKSVVFAPTTLQIPASLLWSSILADPLQGSYPAHVAGVLERLRPHIADRPMPRSVIRRGEPVATLLLRDRSLRALVRDAAWAELALHDRMAEWACSG